MIEFVGKKLFKLFFEIPIHHLKDAVYSVKLSSGLLLNLPGKLLLASNYYRPCFALQVTPI